MHYERLGDTVERLEALTITKRMGNTGQYLGNKTEHRYDEYLSCLIPARLMANHRANSGSDSGSIGGGSSSLGRRTSGASTLSKPPVRTTYGSSAPAVAEAAPPPAYSTGAGSSTLAAGGKRPAPPPPVKPRAPATAAVQYVTALYDYTAQADGDLSFAAGDRIELVKKTESTEDWWTGRLHGVEGVFPGECWWRRGEGTGQARWHGVLRRQSLIRQAVFFSLVFWQATMSTCSKGLTGPIWTRHRRST